MADQEVGFQINDRFYPMTLTFKWGDPALIRDVTGISFKEFGEMVADFFDSTNGDDGNGELDPVMLSGLLAVSVWRQHPRWDRDRVRRFVESLDFEDAELTGPDGEEADTGPPSKAAGESTSLTSAEASKSGSDQNSTGSTPTPSGTPGSPTSREEPSATRT